jgi:group I intron endonuclease
VPGGLALLSATKVKARGDRPNLRGPMKGIYSILCIPTGQRYIGQAKDITKRFKQHKARLGKGCHPNYKLQGLWNRHGPNLFVFSEIEELPTICSIEWLTVREQFWIDHFKPLILNISPYADSYRYLLEKKTNGKQKLNIQR